MQDYANASWQSHWQFPDLEIKLAPVNLLWRQVRIFMQMKHITSKMTLLRMIRNSWDRYMQTLKEVKSWLVKIYIFWPHLDFVRNDSFFNHWEPVASSTTHTNNINWEMNTIKDHSNDLRGLYYDVIEILTANWAPWMCPSHLCTITYYPVNCGQHKIRTLKLTDKSMG